MNAESKPNMYGETKQGVAVEVEPNMNGDKRHKTPKGQSREPMHFWLYDLLLWTFSIMLDLFFREIHPRSSWKVPKRGPVIFVAAPHANQFVDPLILMRVIRTQARRRVSFLIAEKSTKMRFVGWAARSVGAVSVGRALDKTKSVPGTIYLPDPENDPTLVRGVGTNFESSDFQVGGLIVLPSVKNSAANSEIAEIKGPEELRLKKPFKGDIALKQLTGISVESESEIGKPMNGHVKTSGTVSNEFQGTSFKVAPKVDQTQVYDQVFDRLSRNGCVGIFPEGGSHDRTELLPLKAGVAIMALGAVAADPDCGLKIVPCGMNYFHAHKFRSRAVIEFGTPVEIPAELVEEYKHGSRRDAVGRMLELVYNALVAVTVTSPDYDTLMLIQAVRRLYNPDGRRLPLPIIVELNRRLVKGYTVYKDDPRIIKLKKAVTKYNQQLLALNVRDHQLEYAQLSVLQVLARLLYRLGKLIVLSSGVLPGLVLFAPVFIAGKVISIKKSREALAASTVKIQARDVVATWKLLVSLALAPTLYSYYTVLVTWWTYYNRVQGYVPRSIPLWAVVIFGFIFFPAITFAALRFGEIGMDIAKSLRPLFLALIPSFGNTLIKLRKQRAELATQVTNLINELGPELFPDFDAERLISAHASPSSPSRGRAWSDVFRVQSRDTSPSDPNRISSNTAGTSIGAAPSFPGHLSRNESFKTFANIGLFASRPQTPTSAHSRAGSRSRTSSQGGGIFGTTGFSVKGFSALDSKAALEDVSRKIRGAMHERGQARANGVDGSDNFGSERSSGSSTPEVLVMKKNI